MFMLRAPLFPNLPVVVADDSPYVRRLIRNMLMQVGMREVLDAGTGHETLGQLSSVTPGLIVLQWELPEFSAAEILDLLRDPNRVRATNVPVIVTTERPTRRLLDAVAERQVHHVLRKPFSPKMLWQRIGDFYPDQREPEMDPRLSPTSKQPSMLLQPSQVAWGGAAAS
ncbi:response regulator [Alsobacter soli]|uniref:Response regulator n=2 Tax=Alsobacter soli TaxID=2109933 RepID=A0A2T1HXH1_9HYPH|nr:response regulator [Alsobacter soli]